MSGHTHRESCFRFRCGPNFRSPIELIALGADRPEGGDSELVKGCWTD